MTFICLFLTSHSGLSQKLMESFLTATDYRQRIQVSAQEFSALGRPQIRKWLPYFGKIAIYDSQYPFLAPGNVTLQTLSLAG